MILQIVLSTPLDSWFWQKAWMYPEGQVWYFNTILNQSHRWGISPWHTYFTNFLPKLLLFALPMAIYGILWDMVTGRRMMRYWIPCVLFVSAYSFLGHKEWRFIVYVVPILNFLAAFGSLRL
jgi:alpha-1,6-mannosyltransferase